MNLVIGLIIIGLGAFCQSSSYVPINKIKSWSWESYWIVQGVFAWLLFPLLGALLAVPAGESLAGVEGRFPQDCRCSCDGNHRSHNQYVFTSINLDSSLRSE